MSKIRGGFHYSDKHPILERMADRKQIISNDHRDNDSEELDDEPQTDWKSIYCAAILSFVGSIQANLYQSSMFPHLKILDKNMGETFFGLTIGLYSLGQVITSPLFGVWSNRIKRVTPPLTVGLILMLIGNLIYIAMEVVHVVPKRYLLLISRLIVGAGSGNVSVLRSYASTASVDADRSKAIAYVTCGQSLGLVVGPAFQLLFLRLEHPGIKIFNSPLSLSLYTGPPWAAFFMNLMGLLMLYFMFKESYAGVIDSPATTDVEKSSTQIPKPDGLAVFICYLSRFTEMFARSALEALGSPLGMMYFTLTEATVVAYQAKAQGIVGALTFLTYLAYIFLKLERYIKLRIGCVIALMGLVLFHLITFSWPFLPNKVNIANSTTNYTLGCDVTRFSWCNDLPAVNIWVYYISYSLIIGLSFPMLTISLNTLFSKVLGPVRQGTEQGLLQASSGVARMVSPIASSSLYTGYGPQAVWLMEFLVIGSTISTWLVFYGRMIPLQLPPSLRRASTRSIHKSSTKISTRNDSRRVHPV
ncbi:hypothetical protein M3Y94_00159800 [Aphelenchoides besseyi]|nr:hypothetical protein M3Y94_00159800 [Aphelenchoides besseyi]KAI6237083.1 hypothetical protein M3Y95_00227600 [Aphelenchoides besseyi]